jgi:hypothetical protein
MAHGGSPLQPPERSQRADCSARLALSSCPYETGGMKFPRLQVLTAEQILEGKRPQVPFGFTEGYKEASREEDGQARLL